MEDFLDGTVKLYGPQMMRYKGVLNSKGESQRIVFQGVHMLIGSERGGKWQPRDKRTLKMVFIGRGLPKEILVQGPAQSAVNVKTQPNNCVLFREDGRRIGKPNPEHLASPPCEPQLPRVLAERWRQRLDLKRR
jgi:hypothetical protein